MVEASAARRFDLRTEHEHHHLLAVLAALAAVFLAGLLGALAALVRERARAAGLDRNLAARPGARPACSRTAAPAWANSCAPRRRNRPTPWPSSSSPAPARASRCRRSRPRRAWRPSSSRWPRALSKFELQVQAAETARAEQAGGLKAQIEAVLRASTETQFEARKLSAALRRGAGVQGRWGEQTLLNVLEAARPVPPVRLRRADLRRQRGGPPPAGRDRAPARRGGVRDRRQVLAERLPRGAGRPGRRGARGRLRPPRPERARPHAGAVGQGLLGPVPDLAGLRRHVRARRRLPGRGRSTACPT